MIRKKGKNLNQGSDNVMANYKLSNGKNEKLANELVLFINVTQK